MTDNKSRSDRHLHRRKNEPKFDLNKLLLTHCVKRASQNVVECLVEVSSKV